MSDAIPSELEPLVRSTAVAFVSTIGPKGEPQTTPSWFLWRDGVRSVQPRRVTPEAAQPPPTNPGMCAIDLHEVQKLIALREGSVDGQLEQERLE